jgi:hypothetical protein
MADLSRKLLNLLQYCGVRSRRYYRSEAVANYEPEPPLAYYLAHTPRAAYTGPTDPDGLPLYTIDGAQDYLPVLVALFALGHCDRYLRTGEQDHHTMLVHAADWFVGHQQNDGGWRTPWPMRKFNLEAGFVSAMAQGMGISTLVRAYRLENHDDYLRAATAAVDLFTIPVAEGGVRTETDGRVFYEEYPCDPPAHVLNGFLYAVWGLYDLIRLQDDPAVRSLWDDGLSTLIAWLPLFDSGYWSWYHIGPGIANPATIPYHKLHIEQLRVMHAITGEAVFAEYADRWTGYLSHRFNAMRTLPKKIRWNLVRGM